MQVSHCDTRTPLLTVNKELIPNLHNRLVLTCAMVPPHGGVGIVPSPPTSLEQGTLLWLSLVARNPVAKEVSVVSVTEKNLMHPHAMRSQS